MNNNNNNNNVKIVRLNEYKLNENWFYGCLIFATFRHNFNSPFLPFIFSNVEKLFKLCGSQCQWVWCSTGSFQCECNWVIFCFTVFYQIIQMQFHTRTFDQEPNTICQHFFRLRVILLQSFGTNHKNIRFNICWFLVNMFLAK